MSFFCDHFSKGVGIAFNKFAAMNWKFSVCLRTNNANAKFNIDGDDVCMSSPNLMMGAKCVWTWSIDSVTIGTLQKKKKRSLCRALRFINLTWFVCKARSTGCCRCGNFTIDTHFKWLITFFWCHKKLKNYWNILRNILFFNRHQLAIC